MNIEKAETDAAIAACFPVMKELRPHLREEDWPERVRNQAREGYRLAYVEERGRVVAVAGYRFVTYLAWGRALYVDDLVTASDVRSKGHGGALFDWLVAEARREGCDEMHLDSGVHRFGAHRFYLGRRMDITSHHFAMKLGDGGR